MREIGRLTSGKFAIERVPQSNIEGMQELFYSEIGLSGGNLNGRVLLQSPHIEDKPRPDTGKVTSTDPVLELEIRPKFESRAVAPCPSGEGSEGFRQNARIDLAGFVCPVGDRLKEISFLSGKLP
jgi:hypothetical protein